MCVDAEYGINLREHLHYREVTKENSHISHERGRKLFFSSRPHKTDSGSVSQGSEGQCSYE
jgi:hypothetical protein